MEVIIFYLFIWVLGLLFGSFFNALVWRLQKGESIVTRLRSHCVHCHVTLFLKDLIPIASFIALRGRCRFCKEKISWQYPIVELVTGILFVFSAWRIFGLYPLEGLRHASQVLETITHWFFFSVLLILFVYDFKYSILPDAITLPATVFIFFINLGWGFSWENMALAAAIGGGFFLAQFFLSQGRWIGGGDVRFGALMGVLLGWPNILVALFLAYFFGALFAAFALATKKMTMKSQIPFGTFLAGATMVTLFFGKAIAGWYLGLLS